MKSKLKIGEVGMVGNLPKQMIGALK